MFSLPKPNNGYEEPTQAYGVVQTVGNVRSRG